MAEQNFGIPVCRMCGECGKPYSAQPNGMAGKATVCPVCIERSHKDWIDAPRTVAAGGKPVAKK